MADFGKLNFSTSFKPTSAFPLDARCYFESLELAEAAAATAEEVGSSNTVYYYGMELLVDDGKVCKWYTIQRDRTLLESGSGSGVIVDTALDADSTNPVQNKVVTEKIQDMEDTIGNIDILLGTI